MDNETKIAMTKIIEGEEHLLTDKEKALVDKGLESIRTIISGTDELLDSVDMKKAITDEIIDLVGAFLYYDRKEDESLPVGEIENEVKLGTISIDDMVETFKNELIKGIRK